MRIKVGDKVTLAVSGKTVSIFVQEVTTCPFGAVLPQGYLDATINSDNESTGLRYGIKGWVIDYKE
jgi:hypothetical protein